MEAKPGMAKLRKMAEWLEQEYPDAAASLLEGIDECFTINRLELPLSLHRCLASTNLIESSQSGVRMSHKTSLLWGNFDSLHVLENKQAELTIGVEVFWHGVVRCLPCRSAR